jgi:hypothetical protein
MPECVVRFPPSVSELQRCSSAIAVFSVYMNLLHYGLQRSGTNFLEVILRRNFHVHFLNSNKDRSSPLQKHFRLYDEKNIVPEPQYRNELVVRSFEHFESLFSVRADFYLVISKDPYSWFLSYNHWAQKCHWPDVSHHYIEEYNAFYGKLLELSAQTDKFIFLRYFDLIKDAAGVLDRLEQRMSLRKTFFSRIALSRPEKVSQSSRFTEEKRKYYLEEKYLSQYDISTLQLLNSRLSSHVISRLGYQKKEVVNLPHLASAA